MKLIFDNFKGCYRVERDGYILDTTPIRQRTTSYSGYIEIPRETEVEFEKAQEYIHNAIYDYELLNLRYENLKSNYKDVTDHIIHLLNGHTDEDIKSWSE